MEKTESLLPSILKSSRGLENPFGTQNKETIFCSKGMDVLKASGKDSGPLELTRREKNPKG